jgi:hypothetical protein
MFLPLFGKVCIFFGFLFHTGWMRRALGGSSEQKKVLSLPSPLNQTNVSTWIIRLAGRDREKKKTLLSLSPLFFCLLGFVSLAGRRAIGRRSFFLFRCVVASASFHQVNYPFREQRAVRTWGACSHPTNSIGRALSVCVCLSIFSVPSTLQLWKLY